VGYLRFTLSYRDVEELLADYQADERPRHCLVVEARAAHAHAVRRAIDAVDGDARLCRSSEFHSARFCASQNRSRFSISAGLK
jgi:hypothetical protein